MCHNYDAKRDASPDCLTRRRSRAHIGRTSILCAVPYKGVAATGHTVTCIRQKRRSTSVAVH